MPAPQTPTPQTPTPQVPTPQVLAPRVLVCGASIAGPALAVWLHRYGWDVTVVERAPALRTGGQNIDIRGAAREVLRRMDLEQDALAATTGELGTRFVRADGSVIAEFPAGTSDTAGPTAELEILRGDLARLLVDRSGAAEYVYGDRVVGLDDDGDGVDVTFEHGPARRFDLVVAADGIGSSTRRLVFGDEVSIRSLGLEMTYLTIPRTAGDTDWWRWYNAPGGRSVTLRPDPVGTTRAVLTFLTDPADQRGAAERPLAEQRRLLRERFGDAGWEAPRVLDAIEATDDVYAESIGQVFAPRWSTGLVALLGDAAYCASPVSGMGTSLSLVGAYVLAGELAAHVDHRDAFRRYEELMRPYVAAAQQLPPGTPRLANPRTRLGLAAFALGLKVASTRVVGTLAGRLFAPPADKITLPDYRHLER